MEYAFEINTQVKTINLFLYAYFDFTFLPLFVIIISTIVFTTPRLSLLFNFIYLIYNL